MFVLNTYLMGCYINWKVDRKARVISSEEFTRHFIDMNILLIENCSISVNNIIKKYEL